MNEVINTQQLPNVPNGINVPMGNINQGTVAVEASRAVAEKALYRISEDCLK